MKRRDFLKAGLLASASSIVAHPLGKVFHRASSSEGEEYKEPTEKQDKIAASRLMEKYEIPTVEAAEEIYQRMLSERAAYYAGGAFAGSAFRSANNEVNSSTRRNFIHRAVNVLGSGGAALIGAYPIKSMAEAAQDSPLTRPETLVTKYGLSEENAVAFSDKYSELLTKGAQAGAMTATLLQEFFLPPPKEVSSAPERSLEA